MKRFFLPALVAVAAISGTVSYFNQPTPPQLNALGVANVEALSSIELPDLEIECSSSSWGGDCFTPDEDDVMQMCNGVLYYHCIATGDPNDYCFAPC